MAKAQLEPEVFWFSAFSTNHSALLFPFDLVLLSKAWNRKQLIFLLVKQVSKSSATLEWTQEPGSKCSLFMSIATAENDLATHTHLGPITLLMRKSEKQTCFKQTGQRPGQTPLAIAVIYHCFKSHQLKSGAHPAAPCPNKR